MRLLKIGLYYWRKSSILQEIGARQYIAVQLINISALLHRNPELGTQAEAIPLLGEVIALMERADLSHDASGVSLDELRNFLTGWRGE